MQEKDRQLKEQTSLRDEITSLRDSQKIFAAMLAEKEGLSDEVDPQKKANLLKKFDEIEENRKKQEVLNKQKAETEEYNRKADAIYKEAKELFKDDEDKVADVEAYLRAGQVELAQRKVERARTSVEKPKEVNIEELTKQIKIDAEKEILKKYNLLKVEDGLPGGANKSFAEIEKGYVENTVSKADYEAARKKRNL